MPDPQKYFAEGLSVADEAGEQLCTCRDAATAARIAEALSHLSSYEAEHTPPSPEEIENLTKALEEFNRQYDAEHPEFDPSVIPLSKYFQI